MRTVAEIKPEHISAYSLIIEEGTPFYERYGQGEHQEELPGEEDERRMYQMTKEILAQYGYERYEISNYAKKGYACRHNLGYWERAEYLGIGRGASSLMDNQRWIQGEDKEEIDRQGQMEEFMFLGLRKTKGISKKEFIERFGCSMDSVYGKPLIESMKQGMMKEEGDRVFLTQDGILVSNQVLCEFLFDEEV